LKRKGCVTDRRGKLSSNCVYFIARLINEMIQKGSDPTDMTFLMPLLIDLVRNPTSEGKLSLVVRRVREEELLTPTATIEVFE
jgi:hypothetical protein